MRYVCVLLEMAEEDSHRIQTHAQGFRWIQLPDSSVLCHTYFATYITCRVVEFKHVCFETTKQFIDGHFGTLEQ